MRLATLTLLSLSAVSLAGDPAPARRARVALALAQSTEGCGRCRADVEACRREARETGKVLALFVGGCDGEAVGLPDDVIAARAARYDQDGQPPARRRIVLLTPGPGGAFSVETLDPGTPLPKLRAAVRAAAPPTDWYDGK